MMRRPGAPEGALAVGAALVAGTLLAACGSSGPAATRRTTTSRARTRRSTTTSTAPGRGSSTTSSTAAPAPSGSATAGALSTCTSGVLRLREGTVAAAAGTSHLSFVLTNEGPRRCTLDGYPVVALFGGSGAGGAGAGSKLDLRPVELGASPERVVVASGGHAEFVLSVAEVPVNGVGCQQVASLQVVPPGGTGALSVPAGFEACGNTVGVYAVTAVAPAAGS